MFLSPTQRHLVILVCVCLFFTPSAEGAYQSQVVNQFIDVIASSALNTLTVLAAVGVISMAVLQMWKSITNSKSAFLKETFERLFVERYERQNCPGKEDSTLVKETRDEAKILLERLYADVFSSDTTALFTGSVDEVMARFSSGLRSISESYSVSLIEILAAFAPSISNKEIAALTEEKNNSTGEVFVRVRSRVLSAVGVYLESLKAQLTRAWSRSQHIAAMGISTVIILGSAVWYHSNGPAVDSREIFQWALFAILGGAIAPVAKDLVTSLRKLGGYTKK